MKNRISLKKVNRKWFDYKMAIIKHVSNLIGSRRRRDLDMRKRLKTGDFTVFSNNCIGGVFTHDLGRRFNSPTVNLTLDGPSFIKFLQNPQNYVGGVFVEKHKVGWTCPVGSVNDITVDFVHYKTLEEGVSKWKERGDRIVWDNIFVIATGHYGVEENPDIMEAFDKLPYPKIMFTLHEWPQYDWAIYVKGFLKYDPVPPFTGIASLNGKRVYEKVFDLVEWMNSQEKK